MNTPSPTATKKITKPVAKNEFELSADEHEFKYVDAFGTLTAGIPTPYIAEGFYNNGAIESGILPPVVRYITPDYLGCIVERQPQIHTLELKPGHSDSKASPRHYTMALPWTVYVIKLKADTSLKHMYIYFRNSQIWTLDDVLYQACLPNVYASGLVCLDAKKPKNTTEKSVTLAEGINKAVSSFWGGLFNLDLLNFLTSTGALPKYVEQKISDEPVQRVEYSKFFKVYEDITLDEAIEIEYKTTAQTVKRAIDLLNCDIPDRSNVDTIASYFTPIINAAKKKM